MATGFLLVYRTDADPRAGKLPDGTPVLALVEKIWVAMLEMGHDDGGDTHDYEHADAHDGAPVR
jgi:hypothetical protein